MITPSEAINFANDATSTPSTLDVILLRLTRSCALGSAITMSSRGAGGGSFVVSRNSVVGSYTVFTSSCWFALAHKTCKAGRLRAGWSSTLSNGHEQDSLLFSKV